MMARGLMQHSPLFLVLLLIPLCREQPKLVCTMVESMGCSLLRFCLHQRQQPLLPQTQNAAQRQHNLQQEAFQASLGGASRLPQSRLPRPHLDSDYFPRKKVTACFKAGLHSFACRVAERILLKAVFPKAEDDMSVAARPAAEVLNAEVWLLTCVRVIFCGSGNTCCAQQVLSRIYSLVPIPSAVSRHFLVCWPAHCSAAMYCSDNNLQAQALSPHERRLHPRAWDMLRVCSHVCILSSLALYNHALLCRIQSACWQNLE